MAVLPEQQKGIKYENSYNHNVIIFDMEFVREWETFEKRREYNWHC